MKQHIAEIIEGCRCGEESFFTDYLKAAGLIIDWLEHENKLVKVEPEIELVAA